MILTLFAVLIIISLIMIIVGLTRPTESAQALIGFVFLFLLAIVIVNGELEYEVGIQTNTTYSYDVNRLVNSTQEEISYQYKYFNDATSSKVGYYLAIASIVGFAGVLFSLKTPDKRKG